MKIRDIMIENTSIDDKHTVTKHLVDNLPSKSLGDVENPIQNVSVADLPDDYKKWLYTLRDASSDAVKNSLGISPSVESLDPKTLLTLQHYLRGHKILQIADSPWNPSGTITVVRAHGKNYIMDGNHRATMALLRGENIDADVYDFDSTRKNVSENLDNSLKSVEASACEKVLSLTISGGPVNKHITFTDQELKYLHKTVDNTNYGLYRGIGLLSRRIPRERYAEVNSLNPGDPLPDFLKKGSVYDRYASYSKKKSVATSYTEGQVSILMSIKVSPEHIVADLFNYKRLGDTAIKYLGEDSEYYRDSKEVIVDETHVTPIILSINGKLR